jgi:hypothetical protein
MIADGSDSCVERRDIEKRMALMRRSASDYRSWRSLKESPARRDRSSNVDREVCNQGQQKTSLLLGISLKKFNISRLDFTELIRGFALVVQFSLATDG